MGRSDGKYSLDYVCPLVRIYHVKGAYIYLKLRKYTPGTGRRARVWVPADVVLRMRLGSRSTCVGPAAITYLRNELSDAPDNSRMQTDHARRIAVSPAWRPTERTPSGGALMKFLADGRYVLRKCVCHTVDCFLEFDQQRLVFSFTTTDVWRTDTGCE